MVTWNNRSYREIQISKHNKHLSVEIYGTNHSGARDTNVETRAIRIPLKVLKEMVNEL